MEYIVMPCKSTFSFLSISGMGFQMLFEVYQLSKCFVASNTLAGKWSFLRVHSQVIEEIMLLMKNPLALFKFAFENFNFSLSQWIPALIDGEFICVRNIRCQLPNPLFEFSSFEYLYSGLMWELGSDLGVQNFMSI